MVPHSSKSIYNTPEHSPVVKTAVMAPHFRAWEGDPALRTSLSGDTQPNSLQQNLN